MTARRALSIDRSWRRMRDQCSMTSSATKKALSEFGRDSTHTECSQQLRIRIAIGHQLARLLKSTNRLARARAEHAIGVPTSSPARSAWFVAPAPDRGGAEWHSRRCIAQLGRPCDALGKQPDGQSVQLGAIPAHDDEEVFVDKEAGPRWPAGTSNEACRSCRGKAWPFASLMPSSRAPLAQSTRLVETGLLERELLGNWHFTTPAHALCQPSDWRSHPLTSKRRGRCATDRCVDRHRHPLRT